MVSVKPILPGDCSFIPSDTTSDLFKSYRKLVGIERAPLSDFLARCDDSVPRLHSYSSSYMGISSHSAGWVSRGGRLTRTLPGSTTARHRDNLARSTS